MWPHCSLEPTTQPSRVPNGMRTARGSLAKQQRVSQCGAQWHEQARRYRSIQQLPTRKHHTFARVSRTQPPCARPHRSSAPISSSTVAPSTTLAPPATRSSCTPRSFRTPYDSHTQATLAPGRCDALRFSASEAQYSMAAVHAAARCRNCGDDLATSYIASPSRRARIAG